MQKLIPLAILLIAGSAIAEDKVKVPVKRLDKASPVAIEAVEEAHENKPAAASRAKDYNSSRSNTSSAMRPDGSGDSGNSGSRAQDYNSSRSNNINGAQPVDPNDSGSSATRAQDYNSSRSNTTTAIDADDDGDSILTEDVCRDGVDQDCDGVERAAPANHNTTRSNKTQP